MRDLKQSNNRCVIEGKSCSIHRKELAKISEGFGMCDPFLVLTLHLGIRQAWFFSVSGNYTSSQWDVTGAAAVVEFLSFA